MNIKKYKGDMINKGSFLMNGSFVLLASIISAISNWGQLVLFTKSFSLTDLGVYTLALAISNPIFNFLSFQLTPLYVSDKENKFDYQTYFSFRVITSIILILTGVFISSFLSFTAYQKSLFFIVFCLYSVDALRDILDGKCHRLEKFDLMSSSTILNAVSSFVGVFIGVFFFSSFFLALFLSLIFKIIALYFYNYQFLLKRILEECIYFEINEKIIKLLKYSFYLGLYLTIISLNVNVSKYFVNYRYGVEFQGAFSAMSYFVVIGSLLVATVGKLILPKVSSMYVLAENKKIIKYQFFYYGIILILGLILISISYFFGEKIIELFFSEEISKHANIFVWIIGSSVFMFLSSAQGYLMTSIKTIKLQPLVAGVGLVINVGLNFIFIDYFDVKSIIIYSAISFAIQFFINIIIFYKKINKNLLDTKQEL